MELVYLWVEDYKNIHKQGFNFSPRFECKFYDEYDEDDKLKDNSKLDICDKKKKECKDNDYIENFFSDNISVTAIVGKNGSGKSSIIELILDILGTRHEIYIKGFIFLYRDKGILYKYSNIKYEIMSTIDVKLDNNYLIGESLINYYRDTIAIHINNEYKEMDARSTEQIFNENNKYDKNSSNFAILENYINRKHQIDKINESFFIPNTIKINIKSIGYYQSILKDNRDYYSDSDWQEILDLIDTIKGKTFIERLYIIKEIFKLKKEKHINNKKGRLIGIFDDRKNPNQYFFDDELLVDNNIPEILKLYTSNQTISLNDIDNNFLNYINKLPYVFEIELIDKKGININNLSFGEKQLLLQLYYILRHASKKEYQLYHPLQPIIDEYGDDTGEYYGGEYEEIFISNAFIFLDEFEIGLHPHWQQKAINYVVNFLKVLDINFHIILTSHSPFLLSDIPKQNIIFLDKDENGNCKVVDGLKDKKQTFGANIHTLLSDSFFMEDGLMGEFAKGKINEIIDFHKLVKKNRHTNCLTKIYLHSKQKKFWQTQKIIGEEYLKQVIKNHLVEIEKKLLGKDGAKQEEIKRVEAYLESLKK